MFVSWTAYAAWRHNDKYPPAWEYLAARQRDSFYTSMTLVDVLGGYEVPANVFYDPRVRRTAVQAGTASALVNDDDVVRDFQSAHQSLQSVACPELHRFLRGLRAWTGGGFEGHSTSPRYRSRPVPVDG